MIHRRRRSAYARVVLALACTELEASGGMDVTCFVIYARGEHQKPNDPCATEGFQNDSFCDYLKKKKL